jgi:dienelactone hydrolase
MRNPGGWVAALAALLAACADPGPSGPSVRFNLSSTGVPKPLEVPWPSDLYKTDADGTIADGLGWGVLKLDAAAAAAYEAYGALDGFGRHAGAIFALDGLGTMDAVEPATLQCGTTVALVDLDGGATKVPCLTGFDPYVGAIGVVPRDTLQPGRRYAAAVTNAVKLKSGRALVAASGFAGIRDGKSRAGTAGKLYGDAIDQVARDAGIAKDRMVALTVFTTQTTHTRLKKIHDALVAGKYGAAPTLITTNLTAPLRMVRFGATTHAGWNATLDEWLGTPPKGADGKDLPGIANPGDTTSGIAHDAVGAVLSAAVVSPELRRPFTKTAARDDGTIAYDSNGDAIAVKMDQQIPVIIFLPKGPAPASGFPVVIFQHGIGGDRSHAAAVANELARAGIATVATDAPFHGTRGATASDDKTNGRGSYMGPDGLADGDPSVLTVLDMLAGLQNFLAMRDSFWQAALDLVQLRRLIANCDLSLVAAEYGNTTPKLDAAHVGYLGMSMGGFLGTLLAAVEPKSALDPIVLDVPGAGAMHVLTESGTFSSLAVLITASAGVPVEVLDGGVASAWANLGQGIFDGGDPGSFGADAAAEHNIWMIGAMQDDTAPRSMNDSLARALGATQVTPTLRSIDGLTQAPAPLAAGTSGRVVGYYELAPATHAHVLLRMVRMLYESPVPHDTEPRFPKLPEPLFIRSAIIGAQRAIVDFLKATWAGAPKIVVDGALHPGILPVADTDDDGYCDEDERAAGTNIYSRMSTPTSGARNCVRDVGFNFP